MPIESSSSTRKYCSHCNQTISRCHFQEHKKHFNEKKTRKWSSSEPIGTDGSPSGNEKMGRHRPDNANGSNVIVN